MKKIVLVMSLMLVCAVSFGQTAKSVLDKTAAVGSNKNGVQANFTMTGGMGDASGTISVKGRKFQATTPLATMWFNGKTMWTYMKKNDEVNITTPNFITVDKKTYHPTQVKMLQGKKWTVFDISNLKAQTLNDAMFTFNSKDFPSAEVIDLR